MNIRKMTIKDYEEVYELWSNTSGMGMRSIDDSKEGIERYLNRNPETCFIAEEENDIVGVILSGHDGRRGYIYHTSVKEIVRNKGIGKALVNAAMEALKAEGINKAALVAFCTNELGNSFWEAQGFEARKDLVYRNRTLNSSNL